MRTWMRLSDVPKDRIMEWYYYHYIKSHQQHYGSDIQLLTFEEYVTAYNIKECVICGELLDKNRVMETGYNKFCHIRCNAMKGSKSIPDFEKSIISKHDKLQHELAYIKRIMTHLGLKSMNS